MQLSLACDSARSKFVAINIFILLNSTMKKIRLACIQDKIYSRTILENFTLHINVNVISDYAYRSLCVCVCVCVRARLTLRSRETNAA